MSGLYNFFISFATGENASPSSDLPTFITTYSPRHAPTNDCIHRTPMDTLVAKIPSLDGDINIYPLLPWVQ